MNDLLMSTADLYCLTVSGMSAKKASLKARSHGYNDVRIA